MTITCTEKQFEWAVSSLGVATVTHIREHGIKIVDRADGQLMAVWVRGFAKVYSNSLAAAVAVKVENDNA